MPKKLGILRTIVHILAWIVFVGLGIEAGAFITQTIGTLALTPEGAKRLWMQADLTGLYNHNQSIYVAVMCLICIVAVLKTILFYQIVRILYDKKVTLSRPFSQSVRKFVAISTSLAFGIGFFALFGVGHVEKLEAHGVAMPGLEQMKLDGGAVWLFMGVVLLVMGEVFKKGIQMQEENDLTV